MSEDASAEPTGSSGPAKFAKVALFIGALVAIGSGLHWATRGITLEEWQAKKQQEVERDDRRRELAEWTAKRDRDEETRRINQIIYDEAVRQQVRSGLR